MMGDRDFRTIIQTALGSIGKELQLNIDPKNIQTIHLQESGSVSKTIIF